MGEFAGLDDLISITLRWVGVESLYRGMPECWTRAELRKLPVALRVNHGVQRERSGRYSDEDVQ